MAHTCPDCFTLCHCNGDIDDIDFGEESAEAMNCTHFLVCSREEDFDEEYDDEPEG